MGKYKHYSYDDALRLCGKNQLIVPDTHSSMSHNLADLIRLLLHKSPHKYILLHEDTLHANIMTLALHYNKDINTTQQYYKVKETEFMELQYKRFLKSVDSSTTIKEVLIGAKQHALNETYNMLRLEVTKCRS